MKIKKLLLVLSCLCMLSMQGCYWGHGGGRWHGHDGGGHGHDDHGHR